MSALSPSVTGSLGSGQLAALDACLDLAFGKGAGPFGGGEAADDLARRDLRQPFCLLRIGAGQHQRFGGEIDGGGERDRRQRPAEFLGDDAQLRAAEAQAAMLLGNARAEPTLFGNRRPQAGVVSFRIVVEHAPHHRNRAPGFEEPPRLALERLLIVGEIEIHAARASSRWVSLVVGSTITPFIGEGSVTVGQVTRRPELTPNPNNVK